MTQNELAIWIPIRDAIDLSSYSPEHLRELLRGGKIKSRKFGSVWMIDRDSLLQYMKEQGREEK